jgi:hypothetical protein
MSEMPIPTIDDALARLDAKPDPVATCWSCGHTDVVPPALAQASSDPAKHSLRCSECGAVTAFGVPMPKIAVVPHDDRRFVISRIVQGTGEKQVSIDFTLERGYAAEYAMELLSVCDPAKWRAIKAIAAIEASTLAQSGQDLGGLGAVTRLLDKVE